ncbi:MAG: putative toxin-antitoxin system toxin component, PIN family [Gemmatimonadetes bacterium 13_1_40CM_4_69_8]|nr:MAG: putative toxin-antitoxin system toxin component, PIN family [Gemmatimonadetes bacterium 13_1_40CM_4_69_8]PYP73046.1 MAG: putative toxin-antitoxin system toxin component, PIN family [Gemmatimonadota bacterium]
MKIFFDTNVLIGAFTTRGLSADLFRLVVTEHELLTGEVNLTEFRRVLRERFKVPPAKIALVEDQLRAHTIVARPAAPSDVPLRDPEDAWVLASAVAGGAELLVTGDKDLLSVVERAPLPIVDPRCCWDRLRRTR